MIVGITIDESDQAQRWWNLAWHDDGRCQSTLAWRFFIGTESNHLRIAATQCLVERHQIVKLRYLLALYATLCLVVYSESLPSCCWAPLHAHALISVTLLGPLLILYATCIGLLSTLFQRVCTVLMHAPEPYRFEWRVETSSSHRAMTDADWRQMFQTELEPGVERVEWINFDAQQSLHVSLVTFHNTRMHSAFLYNLVIRFFAVHALLLQSIVVPLVELLIGSRHAALQACLAHIVFYKMIPVTVAFFSERPPRWSRALSQVCLESFLFFVLCYVCIGGHSAWWFPLATLYSQSAALIRIGDIRCRFLSSVTSN